MKPFERGVGAKVMVRFGVKPGQKGTLVPATIIEITPKRVRIQRDYEKGTYLKKWEEIV